MVGWCEVALPLSGDIGRPAGGSYRSRAVLGQCHTPVYCEPGDRFLQPWLSPDRAHRSGRRRRRFRPSARRSLGLAWQAHPNLVFRAGRQNPLRPWILRHSKRRRRVAVRSAENSREYIIPAERGCRRHSAPIFHNAAGVSSRGRRSKSRIAQNARAERPDGKKALERPMYSRSVMSARQGS